jgi:GNAT superfamily N-acetyltransferase
VDADTRDGAVVALHEELDRTLRGIAGVFTELERGFAVRTPELPAVWTLNQVCVTSSATADELVALAEAEQADLPFRHVVVRDPATADAVESDLLARGWRVEHDLVMALAAVADDEHAAAVDVVELDEAGMLTLMAEWLREEHEGIDDPSLDQVLEYNRREGRFWDEGRHGVVADDGTPLAVAKSRVHDAFGWVEDVYTTAVARGHGFARALVRLAATAARRSGAERVLILADADDWPQHLYRSVGFVPVGTGSIFHREVAAAPR